MSDELICLTIDDGPSAFRPETLALLRELRVPTVFFEVGVRVGANPQLTRAAAADGHQILNHTHTHPRLTSLPPAGVRDEVLRATAAITRAGVRLAFPAMRPPMTAVDDVVHDVVSELGYLEIGFDVSVPDWDPRTSAAAIREGVLAQLRPGSVVLLHDGPMDSGAGGETLEALPGIVEGARQMGLEFGLLDRTEQIVPATFVSSRRPITSVWQPVPYNALLTTDPPPPGPWTSLQ